jgi:hypothetical protein
MKALGLPDDAMQRVYEDATSLYDELRGRQLFRALRKDLKDD